jgi:acyl-coenzyme A thioesterase PaaI-like protein
VSEERLVHHELCFGCGRTNLFGLLMELERVGEGSVRGRGFVKQDHQGAEPGSAHEGVIIAALSEAMALACGPATRPQSIEVWLSNPAPVGAFIEVQAEVSGDGLEATARALAGDVQVANARGVYEPR